MLPQAAAELLQVAAAVPPRHGAAGLPPVDGVQLRAAAGVLQLARVTLPAHHSGQEWRAVAASGLCRWLPQTLPTPCPACCSAAHQHAGRLSPGQPLRTCRHDGRRTGSCPGQALGLFLLLCCSAAVAAWRYPCQRAAAAAALLGPAGGTRHCGPWPVVSSSLWPLPRRCLVALKCIYGQSEMHNQRTWRRKWTACLWWWQRQVQGSPRRRERRHLTCHTVRGVWMTLSALLSNCGQQRAVGGQGSAKPQSCSRAASNIMELAIAPPPPRLAFYSLHPADRSLMARWVPPGRGRGVPVSLEPGWPFELLRLTGTANESWGESIRPSFPHPPAVTTCCCRHDVLLLATPLYGSLHGCASD